MYNSSWSFIVRNRAKRGRNGVGLSSKTVFLAPAKPPGIPKVRFCNEQIISRFLSPFISYVQVRTDAPVRPSAIHNLCPVNTSSLRRFALGKFPDNVPECEITRTRNGLKFLADKTRAVDLNFVGVSRRACLFYAYVDTRSNSHKRAYYLGSRCCLLYGAIHPDGR